MLALWGHVRMSSGPASAGGAVPGSFQTYPGVTGSMGFVSGGLVVGGTTGAPPAGILTPVAGRAVLPIRPIWGGFLVNTFFYAVMLFLLSWALTVPQRFVREVSRLRRGGCVACGYDLGFDFVPGCPECGWRRTPTATPPHSAR
jgi:hypothetical protein